MFEKLKQRIKKDLDIDLTNFERTRAGKHMKGRGHFSWISIDADSKAIYGSVETATTLVKRKEKLEIVEDTASLADIQFEIC